MSRAIRQKTKPPKSLPSYFNDCVEQAQNQRTSSCLSLTIAPLIAMRKSMSAIKSQSATSKGRRPPSHPGGDRISQIFNQTPAQTGSWVMSIARVGRRSCRDEPKSCANSVALTDRTFAETSRGGDTSPYPVFSCPPAFDFKSAMIIGPSENSDCSVRRVRLRR